MNVISSSLSCLAAILSLATLPSPLWAQNYPAKTVRLVVPFTPGSPTDILGRLVANKFSESWGQPAIVDNRPGAGGTVGAAHVVTSAPDGYTLLMGSAGSIGTAMGLYKNLAYDPTRDLVAISLLMRSASVLAVHPSLPAKSVKELIALAKSLPGKINYSSGGNGAPSHLGMELLNTMAGIKLVHIPYRGPPEAMVDLVAGQVQTAMHSTLTMLPLIRSGRVRALASSGDKRLAELPDLPTINESGVPGFSVYVWYGILAPTGTPIAIVHKLNSELVRIMNLPDISSKVQTQGGEVATGSPEEFAEFIRAEVVKWNKVIKESNAHID